MLDIKFIRNNPDKVKETIKKKFQEDKIALVDELLKKDEEHRKILYEAEQLRKRRNSISQEISKAKKAKEDASKFMEEAKQIPEKIKKVEDKTEKLKGELKNILKKIPNSIHDSVPLGKDESENKELKKWGKPKTFGFKVKNHVELLEELGLADFDSSAKTSGAGFYFLKGELALLNQALIQFVVDYMYKKDYTYVEPPLMLRTEVLAAALDIEEFEKTIYAIKGEDLNMIGTSEYSLLGMHIGDALIEKELPKKYFAYSMCFRKEVGSHGINEKGLWRTHQFNKIEQFIFCAPEDSYKYYEELLANSEGIFQALEIPHRVLECCSGDLATWKSKSCDIEAWRPTTQDYGEVCSLSNCTDFQANDLNIKIIRKDGTREVLHTLNNTAVATSRALVVIVENYQNEDGSITVPKVLVPYMNGIKVIGKNKK